VLEANRRLCGQTLTVLRHGSVVLARIDRLPAERPQSTAVIGEDIHSRSVVGELPEEVRAAWLPSGAEFLYEAKLF
jgi:hypothetical protein